MNFVLRTAHAEGKKKGGHTNPDVRTIYIQYIYNCTPLQRHRSGEYSVKNTLASVCSTLKEAEKVYRPLSLGIGAYTPFRPPTKIWLSWETPDTVIINQHATGPNKTVRPLQGRTLLCFINYLSTAAVVGFFSALNFIGERINGLAHDAIVNRK